MARWPSGLRRWNQDHESSPKGREFESHSSHNVCSVLVNQVNELFVQPMPFGILSKPRNEAHIEFSPCVSHEHPKRSSPCSHPHPLLNVVASRLLLVPSILLFAHPPLPLSGPNKASLHNYPNVLYRLFPTSIEFLL